MRAGRHETLKYQMRNGGGVSVGLVVVFCSGILLFAALGGVVTALFFLSAFHSEERPLAWVAVLSFVACVWTVAYCFDELVL